MDSIHPDPDPVTPPSLSEIRAQVARLEASHRAKGHALSGRIIHVCHHLPVEIVKIVPPSALEAGGLLSPPMTPEFKPEDAEYGVESSDAKWRIHSRTAHTAMVSGMKSLSETHEQIVVAWTGDVLLQTNPQPTPPPSFMAKFVPAQANEGSDLTPSAPTLASKSDEKPLMVFPGEFTDEEKQELNEELLKFGEIESQQDENGSKLSYVPVFLPNDVSKGHYEGFCKKSESQAKYCADQQHSGHCSTTSYGSTLPPLYPPPTHCGLTTTRPTRCSRPRSQRCTGQGI